MADELTPKQERFAQEYLIDLNATQAAIRAGYSRDTASEQGSRLLGKSKVQEAIQAGRERITARIEADSERMLQELVRIGTADIRKLYDADGNLKPIHELDDETAAAISGIDVEVESRKGGDKDKDVLTRTYKIKRFDKTQAINTYGRWVGEIKDRHEHSGPNGGPIDIKDPDYDIKMARWIAARLAAGDAALARLLQGTNKEEE